MVKTYTTQILNTFLLLLLLSCFSHVRLCMTPWTAAHQAPLSLGFSRQEHWSGLPFPSPMHESEKGKGSRSVVSNSSRPHGLQPTRLLCPWDFPGKSTGVERLLRWMVVGILYWNGEGQRWKRFKREEREPRLHFSICLICDVYEMSKGKYEEGS